MQSGIHVSHGGWNDDAFPCPPASVTPSETVCVHTLTPPGYREMQDWSAEALKTHRQVRCPVCGMFKIWLPKAEADAFNAEVARKAVESSDRIKAEARQQAAARRKR